MPEIAVIVPVYDVEKYLRKCVDSLLAQTFSDFLLILVDDGSPDGCGAICDEYARSDARVRALHQPNGGLSAARNAGIDHALAIPSVRWISFVDSDDYVAANYVGSLRRAALDNDCPISAVDFQEVGTGACAEDAPPASYSVMSPVAFFECRRVRAVVAWGKLYSAALWRDVRFPAGRIHEDEWTIPKVLFATDRIAVTEARLYRYLQRDDSIVGRQWSPKRLDLIPALEDQYEFFTRRGHLTCARDSLALLIGSLAYAIHEMRRAKGNADYGELLRACRRRLREKVRLARRTFGYSLCGNLFVFKALHPCFVNRYTIPLLKRFAGGAT